MTLRLVEKDVDLQESREHEVELCQTLRLQVEDLQKRLAEKDNNLTEANKVIKALRDEVQTLQQQLEQHRRKYDDLIGQRDRQCHCGRGNDITASEPAFVEPCVQTGTVPSDCRPSEPEPGSSDAGSSHEDQDITSQTGLLPETSVVIKTEVCTESGVVEPCVETVTVPPEWLPSGPEVGSVFYIQPSDDADPPVAVYYIPSLGPSEAATAHQHQAQDIKSSSSQDIASSSQDITSSPSSSSSSSQDVASENPILSHEPETNIVIKTESSEIPVSVFLSCALEGGPAVVPMGDSLAADVTMGDVAPADDVPDENPSGDAAEPASPEEVGRAVLSVTLQDCPGIDGPGGVCKIQTEVDMRGEGDNGDDARRQGDDGHCGNHPENDGVYYYTDPSEILTVLEEGLIPPVEELWSPRRGRPKGKTTSGKRHKCSECGKMFSFPSQLSYHQRAHARKKSPITTITVLEEGLIEPVEEPRSRRRGRPKTTTSGKHHKCSECGKMFSFPSQLSHHQRAHARKKSSCFECDVCGKILATRESQSVHKRLHTGERPYTCQHCNKAFRQVGGLIQHQKSCPSEPNGTPATTATTTTTTKAYSYPPSPCKCDICGKIISSRGNLAIHKRIHTGERPYACNHCDKTFKQLSGLKQHQRLHREQPQQQDGGGRMLTGKGERGPFECDVCGKVISTRGNLATHKRLHTGEKPYACEHCDNSFTQYIQLATHLNKTHLQNSQ